MIKKMLTRTQKNLLKKSFVMPIISRIQYSSDRKKFVKNSFLLKNHLSFQNLRAGLTFHSHAIEKGLIHDNFRPGYGVTHVDDLLQLLNTYLEEGYSRNDLRYQIAIDTLKTYKLVHDQKNIDNINVKNINSWLIENEENFSLEDKKSTGGYFELSKRDIEKANKEDFSIFSSKRHSVRTFSGEQISYEKIKKAVSLAMNAPSVCNRQSIVVYRVKEKSLINSVLKIQGGLNGLGKGLSDLLIVASDTQFFRSINERNQPYIDGGIYAMNLLYSLQFYGIAACPLNADLSIAEENKIKKQLNIKKSLCLILFIGIGGFKDTNKIPLSTREKAKNILKNVEDS